MRHKIPLLRFSVVLARPARLELTCWMAVADFHFRQRNCKPTRVRMYESCGRAYTRWCVVLLMRAVKIMLHKSLFNLILCFSFKETFLFRKTLNDPSSSSRINTSKLTYERNL